MSKGGLAFLHKKSWHTMSFKNAELVWKAETKKEEEEKKMKELAKQNAEERALEELRRLQAQAGLVTRTRTDRVEWMYSGPAGQADPEQYLLGKEKKPDKETNEVKQIAATPGTLVAQSTSRVGTALEEAARLREDPLMGIMRQEQAVRHDIFSNPLKMKQVAEREKLLRKLMKAKKKQEKRERKSKRKGSRSPSRSASPPSSKVARKDDGGAAAASSGASKKRSRSRSRDRSRSHSPNRRSPPASDRNGSHRDSGAAARSDSPSAKAKRYGLIHPKAFADAVKARSERDGDDSHGAGSTKELLEDAARRGREAASASSKSTVKSETRPSDSAARGSRARSQRSRSRSRSRSPHDRSGKRSTTESRRRSRSRSPDRDRRRRDEADSRQGRRRRSRSRSRTRSRSRSRDRSGRGASRRSRSRSPAKPPTASSAVNRSTYSKAAKPAPRPSKPAPMTEAERAAKLKEMMSDAQVHDKASMDRMLRDKMKAEQEEKELMQRAASPERTASFINNMNKNIYSGNESIEERLRKNAHYRQKGADATAAESFL